VESGGQPGNDNATKGALYNSALKRALARSGGNVDGGLNKVCDNLVKAAIDGEQWAIKEIADRIDGRPAQTQILEGGDKPITIDSIVRKIIDPAQHPDS
jgi:hypothetical protein